jgi:16S rRNA (uracil1498-N3)-methyltransferase
MVTQQHGEFVYVGDAVRDGDVFRLSRDEAHHLTRVRRRREGQEVFATDGRGIVYRAMIDSPDTIRIVDALPDYAESKTHISLICGCLQGDTSRDVVDSAAQLGVRELLWTKMDRSQETYTDNRLERLQRVAIQSLKQTGRAYQTTQRVFANLQDSLALVSNSTLLVAHPFDSNLKESAMPLSDSVTLIVGPEGGFSEAELEMLQGRGAHFVSLGNRRLRSEAAVAAGLAYILTRSGEFWS